MTKKAKKPSNTDKLGGNGRKTNGQFKKGNQVGVGNPGPSGSKAQKLKDAALAAVSAKDIREIIQKQVEKAKEGNNESTKIILDRCLGKPTETHEIGGVDGKPIPITIVDFGKVNDDTE